MGAAESNNVSSAVTNVSNFVEQSTTANSDQVNEVKESVNLHNCTIKLRGDFNVNESAKLAVINNQIVQAHQNTNLNNNIQQQMLQQAVSKVGSLGIGYASASNAASEFVNNSNSIINAISGSASQYNSTNLSFDCDRSYIEANNLNINFNSSADFLSTQTLKNKQVNKIVNDVSPIYQTKS